MTSRVSSVNLCHRNGQHTTAPHVLNKSRLQIEESYQIMLKLGSVERLKKSQARDV